MLPARGFTAFITPFGRFCFNNLPFGISSVPELFQKRMIKLLEGLEGVVCHMDDMLVVGKDGEQHVTGLIMVLKRIKAADLTLNATKCKLSKPKVKILGHCISKGVQADPEKTGDMQDGTPSLNSRPKVYGDG